MTAPSTYREPWGARPRSPSPSDPGVQAPSPLLPQTQVSGVEALNPSFQKNRDKHVAIWGMLCWGRMGTWGRSCARVSPHLCLSPHPGAMVLSFPRWLQEAEREEWVQDVAGLLALPQGRDTWATSAERRAGRRKREIKGMRGRIGKSQTMTDDTNKRI